MPLNEFVQHCPFINEPPRVVRRRLVHGLLPAQRFSLPIVGVDPILNQVLLLSRHKIPEGPVLVGGQLLHPVGEFVADQEHYRVFVVFLNQNLAALDLRVCLPAVHAVSEARPQPQSLSHAVYLVRRLGGQIGPCLAIGVLDGPAMPVQQRSAALHRLPYKIVIDESAVRPGGPGVLRRLPLPLQGGFRVVLPRGVGRELLRLCQKSPVLARYFRRVCSPQSRVIVGSKARVVEVRLRFSVITGNHRFPAVPAEALRRLADLAEVFGLLVRCDSLFRLYICSYTSMCARGAAFCGLGSSFTV